MVPPPPQVLRALHRPRHPHGRRGQPQRGRQDRARRHHQRGVQGQLRAGLQLHAHRVQQRHVDADPQVRAGQVQDAPRAAARRDGRREFELDVFSNPMLCFFGQCCEVFRLRSVLKAVSSKADLRSRTSLIGEV